MVIWFLSHSIRPLQTQKSNLNKSLTGQVCNRLRLTPLYYIKDAQNECLATTIRVRNYGLIVGIVMSAIGFLIFINLSADDFLSPGFVVKETLLQGTQIRAQDYASTSLQINIIKPITLLVSSSDSPIAFDIQVESPKGTIIHNPDLVKPTLTFAPDSTGTYLVTIKNLSSKTTTINVNDGYFKNYESSQVLLVIISMFMIIGGNYFIVHNYFSYLRKYP